jgi:K+-transporting ATPase KdpF subunit
MSGFAWAAAALAVALAVYLFAVLLFPEDFS